MFTQYESISQLGARLKAYRIGKGFSPEDIAEKTGISRAAIYRYEAGQAVKVDVLGKIADLLQVSLASLLGAGVEYFPSALAFFERMRQLESSATQLTVLFGPISYLLTSDNYDAILPDMLQESIPADADHRENSLGEIEKILKILKERKRTFRNNRPNIVSLVSAGELERLCTTGLVGCNDLANVDVAKRILLAKKEVQHIIDMLDEQPMGTQIGVLVDSLPGSSFQIFRQTSHSEVAVSPFCLSSFANIRIGVATISSAPEAVQLHQNLSEKLWDRSLKGNEAASYLKKIINL